MDTNVDQWVDNLENQLETLPRHSFMIAKSSAYQLNLDDTSRKDMKKKLVRQLYFLWDLCHVTQTQRKAFDFLVNRLHDDKDCRTSLAFYDIEVNYLWKHYENNKEIFRLLDIYKEQLKLQMDNTNEFEKKVILESILSTGKRLKELNKQYQEKNGKNFYTWGKTIEEYMDAQLPTTVTDITIND